MAIPAEKHPDAATFTPASHPLDPLTAEEIVEAASILKAQGQLGVRVRFETIVLQEPPKDAVLNFRPGDSIERNAFLVVLDTDAAAP